MICFSDFILSRKPWSYCRLNEPNGHTVYCDISGNNNHLYPHKDNNDYIQAASNQHETSLGERAIQPLIENQNLILNSLNSEIPNSALRFNVPEFKSDTVFYRNHREKIQNSLKIKEMWVDVLIDPHPTDHTDLIEHILPLLSSGSGSQTKLDRLVFSSDWGDAKFLSDCHFDININTKTIISRMYEVFMIFGPLVFTSESDIIIDYDGSVLRSVSLKILISYLNPDSEESFKEVWSQVLDTDDGIASPFSEGLHRFTFGVEQLSSSSIIFRISCDGQNITQTSITLTDGSGFNLTEHTVYSKTACFNQTMFSNIALFYNSAFPNNSWLSVSQNSLVNNRTGAITSDLSRLSKSPAINEMPGTGLTVLDTVLLLGNHQTPIISANLSGSLLSLSVSTEIEYYTPSGIPTQGSTVLINDNAQGVFNGVWTVTGKTQSTVTLKPSKSSQLFGVIKVGGIEHHSSNIKIISDTILTITIPPNHEFSLGDLVSVGYFVTSALSHIWRVTSSNSTEFILVLENSPGNTVFNQNAIIKKTPCGGGHGWVKSYRDGEVSYSGTVQNTEPKKMIIDDTQYKFAKIRMSSWDEELISEPVYFTRSIKNSINKISSNISWVSVGDANRFYWFIPAKQSIITHTQILVYGEIQSWNDKQWTCNLIGYETSSAEQNSSFNYAFAYPEWSILPTGHLLCQSITTAQSDARWRKREGNINESVMDYADSGHHIYPIDSPFITFTP